ncbi:hypothetical protein HYV80_05420 [Candidatus Woesearchaeota archaeon]|nr:hypothetical protein [Candidatus Woesearchaeota archaeon]
MDMSYDLYQMLSPPAIIENYKQGSGLEKRLIVAQDAGISCRSPQLNSAMILKELNAKYFEKKNFFYVGTGKGYEFMVDTLGLPIAAWVYFVNAQEEQNRLEKIIYFRGDETIVIFYHGKSNQAKKGIIKWADTKKVSCIDIDNGEHKREIFEAFRAFLDNQSSEDSKYQWMRHRNQWKEAHDSGLPHTNPALQKRIKYLNIKPKRA